MKSPKPLKPSAEFLQHHSVEEVETANEQQLHEILAELTNTTYFRLFPVDLSRKCKFWNKQKVRDEPDGRRANACRD